MKNFSCVFSWVKPASVVMIFLSFLSISGLTFAGATRVVVIETMPVPVVLEHSEWFQNGLRDRGYQPGDNLELVVLKANGDRDRAVSLLEDAISKGKPNLVVTFATLASQAAWQVLGDTDVPIIFAGVSDPVGAGLIEKVGEPTGKNITGRVYSLFRETKVDLVMRLLRQSIPNRQIRFGMVHSTYQSARGDFKALTHIASKIPEMQFVEYELEYRNMPDGLEPMLADVVKGLKTLENDIDFWWQLSGPLAEVTEYTNVIMRNSNKPIGFGNTLKSVEMGALMAVAPDFRAGGDEIAELAVKALKGLNPSEIPVQAPKAFNFGINLSTALRLGIAVPSDMMELAGKNVFR